MPLTDEERTEWQGKVSSLEALITSLQTELSAMKSKAEQLPDHSPKLATLEASIQSIADKLETAMSKLEAIQKSPPQPLPKNADDHPDQEPKPVPKKRVWT